MTTATLTPTKITKATAAKIHAEAVAAADAAWEAAVPTPMIVGESTTPFGSTIDYSKPTYFVSEGMCGFGSVTIHPARGAYVLYLKSIGAGRAAYGGGFSVYHHSTKRGQSYTRNEAAARAYAAVCQKYGIKAYGSARLD